MENQIERFTIDFFNNLRCIIKKDGEDYIIENVPSSFEDVFRKKAPYRINFSKNNASTEFAGKGSFLFNSINKYLENAGKTTLLKIDFEVNPLEEINKVISFKNCNIENIEKKHKNNYFSRFTFKTNFNFLSEGEQTINEIYVYQGNIVKGDLSGYKIVEGKSDEASVKHLEEDYKVAREELKNLIKGKTEAIGDYLKKRLNKEVGRIKEHYKNYLKEFRGDLNNSLDKIKEIELNLRVADKESAKLLRNRLDRLKKGLLKIADDESKNRILKEQEFTIKDAVHKYSLNIGNKLINTTIIYYPIFLFKLFLKGDNSGRFFEMSYDPLTKNINKLLCESCGRKISELSLCSAGHISCRNCLGKCA